MLQAGSIVIALVLVSAIRRRQVDGMQPFLEKPLHSLAVHSVQTSSVVLPAANLLRGSKSLVFQNTDTERPAGLSTLYNLPQDHASDIDCWLP